MLRPLVLVALLVAAAVPLASGATTTVNISGFAFLPATATIAVGDTVAWTNSDSAPHTATSRASPQRFDTGVMNSGTGATHTFVTQGTYPYRCVLHAPMLGTVQVGANTAPTTTTTLVAGSTVSGVVTLSGTVTDAEGPDTWVRVQVGTSQLTPYNYGLGLEAADGTGAWSLSWDTRTFPNGPITVHIIGLDGLATHQIDVGVVVDNPISPDLIVTTLTAQGVLAKTLSAQVRNAGTGVAGASTLEFAYYDGANVRHVLGTRAVPSLAPSAVATVQLTWDATGKIGSWKLEAVADSLDAVAETFETNNVRQATFVVLVPGPPVDLLGS